METALVSYFASAVESLFAEAVPLKLEHGGTSKLNETELKLKIDDLRLMESNLSAVMGRLIAIQRDMSFQDMQSISRAFDDYLGFKPEWNSEVNNIILALACRHAIVHSGGVVTNKTCKQVSIAVPRALKIDLANGQRIQFTTEEVTIVSGSMTSYLNSLIRGVDKAL
ncbi:MAG: hypothetical protein ABIF19_16115 [Planctomycetota bacterium]